MPIATIYLLYIIFLLVIEIFRHSSWHPFDLSDLIIVSIIPFDPFDKLIQESDSTECLLGPRRYQHGCVLTTLAKQDPCGPRSSQVLQLAKPRLLQCLRLASWTRFKMFWILTRALIALPAGPKARSRERLAGSVGGGRGSRSRGLQERSLLEAHLTRCGRGCVDRPASARYGPLRQAQLARRRRSLG